MSEDLSDMNQDSHEASERLEGLSAAEIDSLPFGYIALTADGTIRRYNRYEADLARKDPEQVLGRNFFREVAPCTQVKEFEGRFKSFVEGEIEEPTLSFDFQFRFEHGSQRVRISFIRSPLDRDVIVTVNRVRDLALSVASELHAEPTRGSLEDGYGHPVIVANADFWQALESSYSGRPQEEREAGMFRLGREWGIQHALRVERYVQEQHDLTLREVELQVALETLSGSVGVLGLGRFEVILGYRSRGLLLVHHHASPFAAFAGESPGNRCAVLAGLHAGFLTYLSGRGLTAREIECSREPEAPCRFLVGTESRLERLFAPAEGSSDAALLLALGVTLPKAVAELEDAAR